MEPADVAIVGGLISATLLTLIVLPTLYAVFAHWDETKNGGKEVARIPLF